MYPQYDHLRLRVQMIEATHWLNINAGVLNFNLSLQAVNAHVLAVFFTQPS